MVKEKESELSKLDVGVIIGRFQIDELHESHTALIDYVCNRHKKVIVLLGVIGITPVPATKQNPLDFETRRLMLHELYPNLIISYVKDMKYDDSWSKQVDSKVMDLLAPGQSVVLYGSKDSFIPYYSGNFPTIELETDNYISATLRRDSIRLETLASKKFRQGVIHSINNQFDMPQTTVDIIIYKIENDEIYILLGRKEYETKYQFVGGFTSVNSESFEEDAIREVKEELGNIEISKLQYLMSAKIDDWRYRHEKTKIKTIVYYAKYLFGIISPSDDIVQAKWVKISDICDEKINDIIIDGHVNIAKEFLNISAVKLI
jgi:bifunctional NMN adenylyltransferase/nudix hydrolase